MFAAKNNITSNRSSSFMKLACWGADFLWSWCLKQKEWYGSRIVKASSFVGASILSATMETVINIRVCYTSTFSHLKKKHMCFTVFCPNFAFLLCFIEHWSQRVGLFQLQLFMSHQISCHNAWLMLLDSSSTGIHFGCMKDNKNRSVAVLW